MVYKLNAMKVLVASILLLVLCNSKMFAQYNIIPEPVSLTQEKGTFTLKKRVIITVPRDEQVLQSATLFAKQVAASTGYDLKIRTIQPKNKAINLKLTTDNSLPKEGYRLKVTKSRVDIESPTAQGVFYGLQTLLQLLPPEIETLSPTKKDWTIPAVSILDYPRFKWRGLLLDASRHFFTVDEVKKMIDEMAKYKFNLFQ